MEKNNWLPSVILANNQQSNKTGIDLWSYQELMPQLISIVLTTIVILIISFVYYHRIKKMKPTDEPRGLVLLVEIIIKSIEKLVIDVMGSKYKGLTLYALYLLTYIITANLLAIVGFESLVTSYTTTLSMAFVSFAGIYYFGIKYQKLAFFKRYLNPIELITQFVPLISLSFRLFGNILGGSIIMGLLYQLLGFVWGKIPYIGPVDLLAGLVVPWFSMYFDLFDGTIQAFIFTILTLVYWKLQISEHETDREYNEKDYVRIKKHKKEKNPLNLK